MCACVRAGAFVRRGVGEIAHMRAAPFQGGDAILDQRGHPPRHGGVVHSHGEVGAQPRGLPPLGRWAAEWSRLAVVGHLWRQQSDAAGMYV